MPMSCFLDLLSPDGISELILFLRLLANSRLLGRMAIIFAAAANDFAASSENLVAAFPTLDPFLVAPEPLRTANESYLSTSSGLSTRFEPYLDLARDDFPDPAGPQIAAAILPFCKIEARIELLSFLPPPM